jgi:sulfite exporter TauE/SafE
VISLLGGVFLASLLGGTHCVAMCGGFVCFYAGSSGGREGASGARASRALAHAAYHGGRLVAYAILGALAGAVGAGIESLGAWAGVERAASIVAGAFMVAWGAGAWFHAARRTRASFVTAARAAPGGASAGGSIRRRAFATTRAALAAIHAWPPASRALTVGLLTALLPCGWLWAFVVTAAGTAHPAWGALAMAVFWSGTVPLLAGLGLAAQAASGPIRRRLPVLTPILLVAVGLWTLVGKWAPHRVPPADVSTTSGSIVPGSRACH